MAIKVRQLVSPNLKLSFPQKKKSLKIREKTAAELSQGFQKLIMQVPDGELTIDKYREMIFSLIPSIKPPIEVIQLNDKNLGGAFQTMISAEEEENGCVKLLHNGYRVKLDLDGNKILSDKHIVVHETRHMFDTVCFPKRAIQRNLEHSIDLNFANRITNTVAFFKHPANPLNREILDEKLVGFDIETIVGILQQVRHSIQSEVNAYKDEFLFICNSELNPFERVIYKLFGTTAPLTAMRKKLKVVTTELQKVLRSRHGS